MTSYLASFDAAIDDETLAKNDPNHGGRRTENGERRTENIMSAKHKRKGLSTVRLRIIPARSYTGFWTANRVERSAVSKAELPQDFFEALVRDMNIRPEQLIAWLRLPPRATGDIATGRTCFKPHEAMQVLGVARLVGQVETIVNQSGNPDGFDPARWIGNWLAAPHPALGGRVPAEFVSRAAGRELLEALLGRTQSGAYS